MEYEGEMMGINICDKQSHEFHNQSIFEPLQKKQEPRMIKNLSLRTERKDNFI